METILHEILLAVASVLATAITAQVANAARRNGLALDADKQRMLHDAAQKAIEFAEEKAADYAKKKLGELTSAQKLEVAVDFVRRKLPGASTVEIHDAIHSELPASDKGAAALYDPTKSSPK